MWPSVSALVSQAHGKVAQALKAPLAEAAATLRNASVVHMDETHCPHEGSANWVWGVVGTGVADGYIVFPEQPLRTVTLVTASTKGV